VSLRLFIADDHAVMRTGLRAVLEKEPDFVIVGEAGNAAEVMEGLHRTPAEVLLLDLSMPGTLTGTRLAGAVHARFPSTHVVILTMHEDPHYLQEALREGARGYVLKKSGAEDVIRAIRAACRGEVHVDPALRDRSGTAASASPRPARVGPVEGLTSREREVCRLLALGHTNVEVAAQLGISDRTVESHRTAIMRKLEVASRAELVRYALDNGLVS